MKICSNQIKQRVLRRMKIPRNVDFLFPMKIKYFPTELLFLFLRRKNEEKHLSSKFFLLFFNHLEHANNTFNNNNNNNNNNTLLTSSRQQKTISHCHSLYPCFVYYSWLNNSFWMDGSDFVYSQYNKSYSITLLFFLTTIL